MSATSRCSSLSFEGGGEIMRPALGKAIDGVTVRVGLAVAGLALVLWALPARRAGDDGGHHGDHAAHLDAFDKAGVTELKEGQRGPAFRLRTFPADGQTSIEAFRDKLVVLNFWATWCTPCTVEMPALEALWQAYRERGLGRHRRVGGSRRAAGPARALSGPSGAHVSDPARPRSRDVQGLARRVSPRRFL